MKIESDKKFLIAQRTKERSGCMLGTDRKHQKLEERIEKRSTNFAERRNRAYDEMKSSVYCSKIDSSLSDSSNSDDLSELQNPCLPSTSNTQEKILPDSDEKKKS
ncbi:uncharacterized protein LOC126901539 isoform X1 [Daktulosphaira vitifoliae]|uniref:uncharacterized protein LOC126901539 isoform X1 n=1 Tax=Daktulosphaira vitifoliae TaxID=58002 RepID=UPI0021AABFEF|nr:uncharacterized protein LOC126901539 isoform X1 [Daktulosphaira vitifoliae]